MGASAELSMAMGMALTAVMPGADWLAAGSGGGSGGTALTPKAHELVRNYRQLQREIEEFANKRFAELFLQEQK